MKIAEIAAPQPHYDPAAEYLHGGPQELEGDRFKRYGKQHSDMGGLFFCKNTLVGRWYTMTYSKGRIWRVRLKAPVDAVLDLTNPQHRARLRQNLSPQEFDWYTTASNSGHMDWAVVDEEVFTELGFRGVVFHERPAGIETGMPPASGMARLPEDVISVGMFHPEDVQIIGYVEPKDFPKFLNFTGLS